MLFGGRCSYSRWIRRVCDHGSATHGRRISAVVRRGHRLRLGRHLDITMSRAPIGSHRRQTVLCPGLFRPRHRRHRSGRARHRRGYRRPGGPTRYLPAHRAPPISGRPSVPNPALVLAMMVPVEGLDPAFHTCASRCPNPVVKRRFRGTHQSRECLAASARFADLAGSLRLSLRCSSSQWNHHSSSSRLALSQALRDPPQQV